MNMYMYMYIYMYIRKEKTPLHIIFFTTFKSKITTTNKNKTESSIKQNQQEPAEVLQIILQTKGLAHQLEE